MTYNKIALMVPTYKRVADVKELMDSAYDTAKDADRILWVLCINEKDGESLEFARGLIESGKPVHLVTESTRQPNLALYFNMMYDHVRDVINDPHIIVTEIGDDMRFKTQGWDTRVLAEINDRDGGAVVYLNDGFIAHEKWLKDGVGCAVNLFTTQKVVEATERGEFMCSKFHAEMIDVAWTLIARYTGIGVYLQDVVLLHRHLSAFPPATHDETYKRLVPLRKLSNTEDSARKVRAYATLAARCLVVNGIGEFNTL